MSCRRQLFINGCLGRGNGLLGSGLGGGHANEQWVIHFWVPDWGWGCEGVSRQEIHFLNPDPAALELYTDKSWLLGAEFSWNVCLKNILSPNTALWWAGILSQLHNCYKWEHLENTASIFLVLHKFKLIPRSLSNQNFIAQLHQHFCIMEVCLGNIWFKIFILKQQLFCCAAHQGLFLSNNTFYEMSRILKHSRSSWLVR